MTEKDRFEKLEGREPSSGIVRKQRPADDDRFSRIEMPGEKPEAPAEDPVASRKYFPCPQCSRNNQRRELYCIYCGFVFPDMAEKTDSPLKVYEIKCPDCGRTANRTQKACIWCGHHFVATDDDILSEGPAVTLMINGQSYSSKDRYLPAHVKKAMVRIKTEGLTGERAVEIVHEAVAELRRGQASVRFSVGRRAANARTAVIGSAFMFGGAVLAAIGRILAGPSFRTGGGWAFALMGLGALLIIVGLGTIGAAGVQREEMHRWRM